MSFNLTIRLLAWEERLGTDGDGHKIGTQVSWINTAKLVKNDDSEGKYTGNNSIGDKTVRQPVSSEDKVFHRHLRFPNYPEYKIGDSLSRSFLTQTDQEGNKDRGRKSHTQVR